MWCGRRGGGERGDFPTFTLYSLITTTKEAADSTKKAAFNLFSLFTNQKPEPGGQKPRLEIENLVSNREKVGGWL